MVVIEIILAIPKNVPNLEIFIVYSQTIANLLFFLRNIALCCYNNNIDSVCISDDNEKRCDPYTTHGQGIHDDGVPERVIYSDDEQISLALELSVE